MTETASNPSLTSEAPPPPARRRRGLPRAVKVSAVLAGLAIGVIVTLPTFLSADFFRAKIESRLSEALGTDVSIEDYSLGWLSGFTLGAVRVSQPPGFDLEGPAIALSGMKGDLSFVALLSGRLNLSGTVEGLRVQVYQRADGTTNLGELGLAGRVRGPDIEVDRRASGDRERRPPQGVDLGDVQIDLRIVDASIDIEHERHGVLESMRDVEMKVSTDYGSSQLTVEMGSVLHRPGTDKTGSVKLTANVDTTLAQPTMARYEVVTLDVERYRPLLATLLPDSEVSALAGVIDGGGSVEIDVPGGRARLEGELAVARPHLAGPLFAGMDIGADRWVIRPELELSFGDGGPVVAQAENLRAELGFATLRGLPAAESAEMAGGRPALGLRFEADLGKLLRFGGPIPAWAGETTGQTGGRVALALDGETSWAELASTLLERLVAHVELSVDGREVEGHDLKGLRASLDLAGGVAKAGATADVAGGPLKLSMEIPSMEAGGWPCELKLSWDGAHLAAPAVELLRYPVPVLAGLDPRGEIDFASGAKLDLDVKGPLLPAETGDVLAWLAAWSGRGGLVLTDGEFVPSPKIAPLFEAAKQSGKLLFSEISTDFTIESGAIATSLLEFTRKKSAIQCRGETRLDGALAYTIDITEELRQHRDGLKVLERLGGTFPPIVLGGTITDPVLRLPADQLLQQGAQNAVDQLLQKQLDRLFKKKEKEQGK